MNKEDTISYLTNEGFARAMELLDFCVRAQTLIPATEEGLQWLRDFGAYLLIQTGDM